jgi:hypothetical protein
MARGNPAMKAKRVTGPTPNTVLRTVCASTTCSTKGCESTDLVVTNPQAGRVVRRCRVCWKAAHGQRAAMGRSWRPAWMSEPQ